MSVSKTIIYQNVKRWNAYILTTVAKCPPIFILIRLFILVWELGGLTKLSKLKDSLPPLYMKKIIRTIGL